VHCGIDNKHDDCKCHQPTRGAMLQGFAQPTLLLLLMEKPSHGYELTNRLGELGLAEADPGGIYRNLQKLEADNFIESSWDTSGSGPARKVYHVTPEGRDFLDTWAGALMKNRDLIQSFIDRYKSVRSELEKEDNDE